MVYLLHCPTLFPSLSSRASLQTLWFAFILNDVGLEKRLLFFHPPDTQSMWSLLPSLLHCTLFFPVAAGILSKGDQQIHSPRDPTPEMKKHQTILAGLSLPNRLCWLLIENIELGNLHFLVLNLPHIILGYCLYLYKAGLRSPFYYKGFKS